MPPTTCKAIHIGDRWSVFSFEGSIPKTFVASEICTEETARIIAALMNMNAYCADELESGRVEIVKREQADATN